MNKKIKLLICILIFAAGLCSIFTMGCSSLNDYVHITEMDYKAVVDREGKVTVTERITFDIHAASENNLFWELWRDLPEEWEDGQRVVSYNVLSVKRLTTDGKDNPLEFGRASKLYWSDSDYISPNDPDLNQPGLGPNRWYHSKGPYDDYQNFECVLIYVDGLYRENTVFEIKYEIIGAAVRYLDCSELYLPMYSGGTIKHLKNFSASIQIPTDIMPSDYHAWTYGTTAHEIPFDKTQITEDGNSYINFSFSLNKDTLKFKPYNKYIEFSLVAYGDDKHNFTQSPTVRYYNENMYDEIKSLQANYESLPNKYLGIKITVLIILIVISALILFVIYLSHKAKKKKCFKPTVDYDFYREIPNNLDVYFAGAFAFCKHKLTDDVPGGYAAAMLGLVRKGYISVDCINTKKNWDSENTQIVVLNRTSNQNTDPYDNTQQTNTTDNLTKLSPSEFAYLKLIKRHAKNGVITLKGLENIVAEDYEYTSSFTKEIKASVKQTGMAKGYFREPDYKKQKTAALKNAIIFVVFGIISLVVNFISYQTRLDLAFGAFFVLGAAFLVGAVLMIIFSKSYVLLTQIGEDEYSKWRGLYNFLNSETLINERTVPEVAIWEDYLVYATAFGISEKVIKALKVKFPDFPALNNSVIIRHPYLTSMYFTHMYVRSFRGATRRAGFSRISGGGSYGSGSRGGGGGGGGH